METPKIARRSNRDLTCPKCRGPLAVALDEDIEVDVCKTCKGVWVDIVEEKVLLKVKPDVFSIDELRRLRKLYQPLGRLDSSGYVPCPICQQLMHRRNWGSHSGVVVDKCADHGTWYDVNELEKIREFISLGGIEFEKYKLTDQGLTELDSKLTKEIDRIDRKIDSAYRKARLYSLLGL
jgi:Zn-finger nucleic acid-binding protein